MTILSCLTRNWADTDEGNDPDLVPVDLPLASSAVVERIVTTINDLPLFRVESVDRDAGVIRATRTTRLFRFVDDVTLRVEAIPTGTRIHARSQARLGKGDFGQNRRNLLTLLGALRTRGANS